MEEKSGDAGIYRNSDFLRKVFDDYMISLLGIVMLWSFPFPCNHGYKAVVGSNCIYNCCQQLLSKYAILGMVHAVKKKKNLANHCKS